MNQVFEIFKNVKRDALAGTITGIMALPLTVGICLMSNYPIMTGLYTVIFAGIISFISYLFKPGNYTGVPGVAAGLAPMLALGVHYFGIENMPFVILLTSFFQMIVWRFKWEKFILRTVPHYLVEGLLAGVGIKIALKFIPFLYDINGESNIWLNSERQTVLILSVISFAIFIWLYKTYKDKMPALPYIFITISSVVICFFIPLAKISIDNVPFQLILPVPHFTGMHWDEIVIMASKMIAFAIVLGIIDVIEQVMSNVAIEKMDPYKRACNSNNSLLAIWIANMGATFFGGMTNLDGLSKSTTNTIAGAVTKLSNLFTSIVLLVFVIFPNLLSYLPKYALGVIMVYSGWKMITNITQVKKEGRYALIMAGVCGLLVWKLGIFEGLLFVLATHSLIQYILMKKLGKTRKEIWQHFKSTFGAEAQLSTIDQESILTDISIPVLDKLQLAINNRNIDLLMKLYSDDAILVPSFSKEFKKGKKAIKEFYKDFFEKEDIQMTIFRVSSQKVNNLKVDTGTYLFKWKNQGFDEQKQLRFSLIIDNGKIITDNRNKSHRF